jgi:hypothetical protein
MVPYVYMYTLSLPANINFDREYESIYPVKNQYNEYVLLHSDWYRLRTGVEGIGEKTSSFIVRFDDQFSNNI